jgi:hypothetical protein
MIARISAYSAAEAPESSFSMLMKFFIVTFLPSNTRAPRGSGFSSFAFDRRENAKHSPDAASFGTE